MHGRVCVSDGIRPLYIGIRIHVHVTYVGQWFHMTTTTKQNFHLFLSTSVLKDDNYLWISTRIKINIIIKSSTQKKKNTPLIPGFTVRFISCLCQNIIAWNYCENAMRMKQQQRTDAQSFGVTSDQPSTITSNLLFNFDCTWLRLSFCTNSIYFNIILQLNFSIRSP